MIDLTGKVALVTGSSRGIGAATAIKLAEAGADLVINYASSQGPAEEIASKINKIGRKAIVLQANVANFDEAKSLIKKTKKEFGKLDILVNNAGITNDKLLLRMKEDDWDQVIDINLKGVFNTTKSAARYLMKSEAGRIINLSSVVGLMGNAGQANYAAAKAGILGLTKSTARELAVRGVTANVVAPGFIETDMTENLPENVKAEMLSNIPANRFGKVDEVANLIVFLASPLAQYINGQVINVDGGMLM